MRKAFACGRERVFTIPHDIGGRLIALWPRVTIAGFTGIPTT